MRILTIYKTFLLLTFIAISAKSAYAQEGNTTLKQDSKFEQILTERRKINASNAVNERYKIQIFSGDSDKAKTTLNTFRQQFNGLDGTIVFFTPNYKVWVGNFKTRIEAERNLVDIKKRYPNVLLIKPSN